MIMPVIGGHALCRHVGRVLGIAAILLAATTSAMADETWTMTAGKPEDAIRCDLGFADPAAPIRSFVSIAEARGGQLVLLVRQPDAVYGEFVPYSVTLKGQVEALTLPAKPISSQFLIAPLSDQTDPNHRLIPIVTRPFDVLVTRSGTASGPVQHVAPAPFELGRQQAACTKR